MKSLRTRLTLGLAFSLVLLLLLQWAIASFVIEHLIENQLVSRLTQDGESLLAGMRFDADNRLEIDPRRVNTVYQRPLSGHYYVIDAGGQRLVSRSLWDSGLVTPRVAVGKETRRYTSGPADQRLLVVAHGYRKQNADITIAVAEDLTALNAGLTRFQLIYGAVSLAILAVLLLTQYLIVTGGLRPLKKIHADMARLERGEIDRIETMGPAEIAPVVSELNRLLAAMRKRTRRSRDALGNLAHALKTRLAVLGQAATQTTDPQLRADMEASIETMRRIVERELKRARLLGDMLPGRRVDIADLAADARGQTSGHPLASLASSTLCRRSGRPARTAGQSARQCLQVVYVARTSQRASDGGQRYSICGRGRRPRLPGGRA